MNKFRAEHYLRRVSSERVSDVLNSGDSCADAVHVLFPELDTAKIGDLMVSSLLRALDDKALHALLPKKAFIPSGPRPTADASALVDALQVIGEEVIFEGFDTGWQRKLPVRLITYGSGKMDLHRQSGSQFEEHVEAAKRILAQRGYQVSNPEDIGPTGIYMSVTPSAAQVAVAA